MRGEDAVVDLYDFDSFWITPACAGKTGNVERTPANV